MNSKKIVTHISFHILPITLKKMFLATLLFINDSLGIQAIGKNLIFNKTIKTDKYLSVFFLQKQVKLSLYLFTVSIKVLIL